MAKPTSNDKSAYEVLSPVDHDCERYEIGEQIELTQAAAAPLLSCRAIAELKKPEPKKS